MKFVVLFIVVLASGESVPHNLVSINEKDLSMSQNFDHNVDGVKGFYPCRSPEGQELFVRYVADKSGYRVVDSNALPTTMMGARADGNQGTPRRRSESSSHDIDELNSIEDFPSFEDNSSSPGDRKLRNQAKLSKRRTSKKNNDGKKVIKTL